MTTLPFGLPSAGHELSSAEIAKRFGPLLREGLAAFRSDLNYYADMAEDARLNRDHAEAMSARREKAQERYEVASQRLAETLAKSRSTEPLVTDRRALKPRGKYEPSPEIIRRDAEVYRLRMEGKSKARVMELLSLSFTEYGHSTTRLKRAGKPIVRNRSAEQIGNHRR